MKRGYLNTEEKNFFMVAKGFIQYINGERNLENKRTNPIWEEWSKRGMITPGMQKNLKLVKTYLTKFCEELERNLDDKEVAKLSKQLEKFDYRLVDDYTLKKIMRDINDHYKYAVIEREKLMPVLEDIAAVRCVGCKEDYKQCPLHHMLDDILIAYVGEQSNCPYACDLDDCSDKKKKEREKLRLRIRKNNKFYKE